MKWKIAFVMVLLSLAAIDAFCQVQSVNQSTSWLILNQNIQVSSLVTILVDEQLAFAQENQAMQHMVRGGVNFNLLKGLSVVPVGYAYVWNYLYGKQPASIVNNEQLLWQQLNYNLRLGRVGLSQRLRLEERFIQNNQMSADGRVIDNGYSNYQDRLRYRLNVNLPINKGAISPGTFFANAWTELFYSWGKMVQYHSINQTRGFVGLGYQVNREFTFVGGPYFQRLIKGTGNREENNLGYQIQMTYLFNLVRK